ncbi:MAG: LPS-assembly protein LptD, partial [Thiomicrospira sp.]|uniref:LPS-assembly protein LptD n=1 Tax=Thiomicrospira sp. TaxID=935 RepID=UPI0019DA1A72
DRGVVLDNEFRYLQPKHRGTLQLSLINDQLTQKQGLRYVDRRGNILVDPEISERWRLGYNGSQNWGYGFSSNINWQEVSDPDFYNDIPLSFGYQETRKGFSDASGGTNQTTSLVRNIKLNYRNGPLQAHIQHYGFLPLRNGENNYLEKHPEIGLNLNKTWYGFRTNVYLESTEFVRYQGFNNFIQDGYVSGQIHPTGVMGQRTLVQPKISYQLSRPYGYLQTDVQANYRQYELKNADPLASTDNTVMQYAIKGGLIFERDLSLLGRNFIQTMEPEVQFLYVPYVDQSHLTKFDTSEASLDFSNIFRLNRFSGFDRIGDTNQISVAITNRVLNESGKPLADAAVGQIFYLEDRQVTLAGNELQEEPKSDYFVKLGIYLKPLYFASTSQFDHENKKLNQINNRLKVQAFNRIELLVSHQALNLDADPALDNTANVNRRQQTIAAGAIIRLNSEWQLSSYVNYDIQIEQRRELLVGLRYDDCCWGAELILDKVQVADQRYKERIQFVIEFKGLSSFGSRLSDTIKNTLNF